eukprot:755269-Hanusia_phi.AAC.1
MLRSTSTRRGMFVSSVLADSDRIPARGVTERRSRDRGRGAEKRRRRRRWTHIATSMASPLQASPSPRFIHAPHSMTHPCPLIPHIFPLLQHCRLMPECGRPA